LDRTDQMTKQLDEHLPAILADTETAADTFADAAQDLEATRGLLGRGQASGQDKELARYGAGLLDLIAAQDNATIGVKNPGPRGGRRRAPPARTWAAAHRRDAEVLSLLAISKGELLHALARDRTPAPWHIQIGNQTPRLLADWLLEKEAA